MSDQFSRGVRQIADRQGMKAEFDGVMAGWDRQLFWPGSIVYTHDFILAKGYTQSKT